MLSPTKARAQAPPDNPSLYAAAMPEALKPKASDKPVVRVVVRGLAEAWTDESLGAVYRAGSLMPGLGVVVPIWGPLSVDVEAAYAQLQSREAREASTDGEASSDPRRFHLAPMALSATYTIDPALLPIAAYAGGGPTFTVFQEQFAPGETITDADGNVKSGVAGVKIGFELRAGLRFDLGMVVAPRTWPPEAGGIRSIELELFGAKRFNANPKPGLGLDLNAWRGGLGLALGF